jgi:myo-inositol-1(or 4)-monophosphatase
MGAMGTRRPGADQRATKAHAADWVTETDILIERHVREQLALWFPAHAVVGEELGGEPGDHPAVWYVDPIDGTTNYVHGLPGCTFSLAMADRSGLVTGVVADPHGREVFSATRGAGARLGGHPISCADADTLTGGIVLTELAGPQPWPGLTQLMEQLGSAGCVTRIIGSSAHALASVADGRCGAVVLAGSNPIDVAAGVLIAREAGAVVVGGGQRSVLGTEQPELSTLLVTAAPGVAPMVLDLVAGLPRAAPS